MIAGRVYALRSKTLSDEYFLVRVHYRKRDMFLAEVARFIQMRITRTLPPFDPEITVAEVRPVPRSRAKNLTAHGKIRRS